MKHTYYPLRLDTPCSQPWEGMTPIYTGQHRELCARNVVDLSGLRDDQVLQHLLKKPNDAFCGRVTQAQLNRHLVARPETTLSARLVNVHVDYARQQVPFVAGVYPEYIEVLPALPFKTISTGGFEVVKWKERSG